MIPFVQMKVNCSYCYYYSPTKYFAETETGLEVEVEAESVVVGKLM